MIRCNISIYFDTRRKNSDEKYPVRLRVYFRGEARFYSTGLILTQQQFEDSYQAQKVSGQKNKDLKAKIESHIAKANDIKDDLQHFSFEKFEKKLLQPLNAGNDIFYYYSRIIEELNAEERVGTALNYGLSQKSLKAFLEFKGKKDNHLFFDTVTKSFLNDYERWMLNRGKSLTTVGIYLRPLRAVFNSAMNDGEIDKDIYPFGKRKYQIPAGRNIKKALKKEDLQRLFEYPAPDLYMQRAKDFWFFSYVCNGMNMRDIAELKYKYISERSLSFVRNKTKNTTRANNKPIVVPLTEYSIRILKTYGNKDTSPDNYVFPIFKIGMAEREKLRANQTFTRFVNQHIKRLAKLAKIPEAVSTYWARHSFVSVAVQNGASLPFVQESLGHNSIKTTMDYWSGFDDEAKKEVTEKLLKF